MEKISKIYAITLDRSEKGYGSGGNCKVVSLIRNGVNINKEEDIIKYIETDCKIFSNKIYESTPSPDIGDLIEISQPKINPNVDKGRNFYVSHSTVKKVGTPVIDIPSEYISNEYIDLEQVWNFLTEIVLLKYNISQIYLCDERNIFGPFRIANNSLIPTKGTHTYSFEYNIDELIEDTDLEFCYLITEPKSKIKAIDCSTTQQLVDFLKDRIQIDRVDLNLLIKISKEIQDKNEGALDLDAIRLNRASNYIDRLKLSLVELQNLLNKKDQWNKVINDITEEYKKDFKNLALQNINQELKQQDDLLELKKQDIIKVTKLVDDKEKKLKELSDEFSSIVEKKEDLILNIKLLAGLNNIEISKQVNQYSFEIFSNSRASAYNDLDDFYEDLNDQWKVKIPNQFEYQESLFLLKENKFIIANNTIFVLNLISHLGKTETLLQNAEPDWLKFKYWKENGLDLIVEKSAKNPDINYFYILQDFNVASFECYGKPILDFSNKIRNVFPGTGIPYPSNLHIILVRADEEIDDFGFPINKSSFKNWRFLPIISDISKIDFQNSDGINLEKIDITSAVKDYSQFYF
ncbi:hypothetical protein QE422_001005 [Chryseobacterium sp. SORGH_AS 447]|uniref:hypothetical protein n=1 Tax=Chryseobacterium sp. SORGH_AS_0447 TaxID=3041769 RepID=UPI002784A3DF|nr:hypothetical protein [Chryseobacterium sp. SORGH_AS_0447]MDQ1160637.1 hypothetical protein [Chryseobacterium sp. SORGH_AS_0447]